MCDPTDNSNEGKNISNSFNTIIQVIARENELIKQKEIEELARLAKLEEEKQAEIEKEKQAKQMKDENKIANIQAEKMAWKDARRGPRQPRENIDYKINNNTEDINNTSNTSNTSNSNDNSNYDSEKSYRIPKQVINDNNDDWTSVRSKREPIVNTSSERNYKPGTIRKGNIASVTSVSNPSPSYTINKSIISRAGIIDNNINTLTEDKVLNVPVQKINQNFRQDKEDELFRLLYKKK
jgi:hypothetical protein